MLESNDTMEWVNGNVDETTFDNSECIHISNTDFISYEDGYTLNRDAWNMDFNGYEHTYANADITANGRDISQYPAFEYCIKNSLSGYEGYLPAFGELKFLIDKFSIINYLLVHVSNNYVTPKFQNVSLWSSTEIDHEHVCTIRNGKPGGLKKDGKYAKALVLFKEIKK